MFASDRTRKSAFSHLNGKEMKVAINLDFLFNAIEFWEYIPWELTWTVQITVVRGKEKYNYFTMFYNLDGGA